MQGSFSQAGFFYQNHIAAGRILELLDFGTAIRTIALEITPKAITSTTLSSGTRTSLATIKSSGVSVMILLTRSTTSSHRRATNPSH
jgi:hypothetical protein